MKTEREDPGTGAAEAEAETGDAMTVAEAAAETSGESSAAAETAGESSAAEEPAGESGAAEETSKAEKERALYYSTNGKNQAKEGNAGVYAYRNRGGQYYNYYVIDFDEGFVYFFSEGNGDESCERLRIQEGDLNEGVKVTYHDHGDTWDNYLHFKWKRQPDHLILVDHNRFEWDYYATDLTDALRIKAGKRISDY